MKVKTKPELGELEEALEVVLDEVLTAAHEFMQGVKKLQNLKPTNPDYEGRYGELASAAFLLKLKADAAHKMLEQIIEAEPDEGE